MRKRKGESVKTVKRNRGDGLTQNLERLRIRRDVRDDPARIATSLLSTGICSSRNNNCRHSNGKSINEMQSSMRKMRRMLGTIMQGKKQCHPKGLEESGVDQTKASSVLGLLNFKNNRLKKRRTKRNIPIICIVKKAMLIYR